MLFFPIVQKKTSKISNLTPKKIFLSIFYDDLLLFLVMGASHQP